MNGFVQVHPHVSDVRVCPKCGGRMRATDWAIPGQWTLGRYRCEACRFDCWGDLPFNLGVLAPCYIDTETGQVFRLAGPDWYAAITRAAWSARRRRPIRLRRKVQKQARRICLVPALGNCWGDGIMTVAKINALQRSNGLDVVVLATANMEPYVPEWVAEMWLVDVPHGETAFWNEALAEAVKAEVSRFEECHVPTIFQPPRLTPKETSALTGIGVFDRSRWDECLERAPTVTFLWRDDRCWSTELRRTLKMIGRLRGKRGLGHATDMWVRARARVDLRRQFRRVNALAREMRAVLPRLDFAVCGQGVYGTFPDWVVDLRRPLADQAANRLWCERAARSHLLVGVLGSQMVLPSGHAGGVIDLVPSTYLRNVITDWLVTSDDVREALFLYRAVPLATDAVSIAEIAISMLVNYSCARSSLHSRYYAPLHADAVEQLVAIQAERTRILRAAGAESASHLIGP